MRKIILLTLLLISAYFVNAQTLEEINFSPNNSVSLNTYTTDINNAGFVCGYYETLVGEKVGYVLTPRGKRIEFPPSSFTLPYTHISVEGINDSCTIIINATTSTASVDMYKAYFNKSTQSFTIQAISGSWQPGLAKPFGITNKNVYSGWYPNASDRFGFLMNDSSASSIPFWNAKQYNFLPTYFFKGNDNDLYCGYYLDGSLNTPVVFNAVSNTYAVLPFTNNMKLRDINNANWVCGEYKQTNGFYCGFYGLYNGASLTNFTSINSLFSSNTVQNVINAVNDSMAFVGSYLHPVSNTWVGFIYRPNLNEYRLPKFNYAKDTWTQLLNNAGTGPTDVFSPGYYSNFNYSTLDPFVGGTLPVLNAAVLAIFPGITLPSGTSVAWRGFCEESNLGLAAKLANLSNVLLYENNFKPLLFTKYSQNAYSSGFGGYCFGFSYSALLKKYRPDLFSLWFSAPTNYDLSLVTNTDSVGVLAIERSYLKQFDPQVTQQMFPITTSYWRGMYRFKNEYLKDSVQVNPQSLGIGLGVNAANPNGGHNVLPYKIRTPKKFPFNYPTQAMDTLFVYDSNYPNDSTQFFAVKAPYVEKAGDTATNTNYSVGSNNAYEIRFQKIGIRDSAFKSNSVLNKKRSGNDSTFRFTIESNLFYTVKNAAQAIMKLDASGFTNNCSNILPLIPEGKLINRPKANISDSNSNFTLTTTHYADTVMQWAVHKELLTMGISRIANLNEVDHGSINHRRITYGNPDNVTKNLNCYFIQLNENSTQATTVIAQVQNLIQNDSIVTENPGNYVYKITKISSGNTIYNLTTYTFANDTAKQFNANNIQLNGNSSHVISSVNSTGKTIVYIDEGLNGINDDTLFVQQIPLGSVEPENKFAIQVNLYPVPVTDYLMLESENIPNGSYQVVVAELSGKIVQVTHADLSAQLPYRLDCSALARGNYMLFLRNQQDQVVYANKFSK